MATNTKQKKTNKSSRLSLRKIAIIFLVVFVLVIGMVFIVRKINFYNNAATQANLVQTRELLLLAVRGVKKDAPVEPRTGDIYFPENRLFLPNPHTALPITYLDDIGNIADTNGGLSISTYPVFGTSSMYMANSMAGLYAAIPKLQACSRGVKVVTTKFAANDNSNQLKSTVHLKNGRTVYIYLEKGCPELNPLATSLNSIQSY